MSKKIQNATKTAKKVKKISAKKVIHKGDPKPLMSLEEAREVLKRHVAADTEEGAEFIMEAAEANLKSVCDFIQEWKCFDGENFDDVYEWHKRMRITVKMLSDAVELMIAADINNDNA